MKAKRKSGGSHGNHRPFLNGIEVFKQVGKFYTELKHNLPPKWEQTLKQWTHQDWTALARKRQHQITKEVKFYADGIVHTLSRANILPNKNRLLKEAKKNLRSVVHQLEKTNVAHVAKNFAKYNTRKLLAMFNFPTKKDVTKLNVRLSALEKRMQSLRNP